MIERYSTHDHWVDVEYDEDGYVIDALRGVGEQVREHIDPGAENKKAIVMGWLANVN